MAVAETTEIMFLFGETLGFWIQTGAYFISAAAAVAIIRINGHQTRGRATIDLIMHQKSDKRLNAARETVVGLHAKAEKNLAKFLEDEKCPEYIGIRDTLNNYEFIATGIRLKAFDEKIMKRMRHSVIMKDWRALKGMIEEMRIKTGFKTLYQEYEWLCNRWERNPLKKG